MLSIMYYYRVWRHEIPLHVRNHFTAVSPRGDGEVETGTGVVVEKFKIKPNKLKETCFVQATVFAYPNSIGFYMVQLAFFNPIVHACAFCQIMWARLGGSFFYGVARSFQHTEEGQSPKRPLKKHYLSL